jgi:uncharacterized protein (TIGR02246 family)
MARSTRAADIKAIHALDEAWTEAATNQDVEALVALYAKDATLVWPGSRAVKGTNAIRRAYKKMYEETPSLGLQFIPDTITISKDCDLATDFGKVIMTMRNQDGKKVRMVGKYLVNWIKVRGRWRVLYDSWNENKSAT